jgi:hypothetical protein
MHGMPTSHIPGIVMGTHSFRHLIPDPTPHTDSTSADAKGLKCIDIAATNWFKCVAYDSPYTPGSLHTGNNGVVVYLNGYISDVACSDCLFDPTKPAQAISSVYNRFGVGFAETLRGSYSGIVWDPINQRLIVFNDRRSTRPLYQLQQDDNSLLITSDLRLASRICQGRLDINKHSVIQFMIRGCFYGGDTIFSNMLKLPQASIFSISIDRLKIDQYWQLNFSDEQRNNYTESAVLEEANHLLQQSARRLLTTLVDPIVFLSGGIDSRLMLGYLQHESNDKLPSITWGTRSGGASSDLEIGGQLAAACDLPHETFSIDLEDLSGVALQATLGVDGRSEVLDSPSLTKLWPSLSGHYKSFLIGDEWFGWKGEASDASDALFKIGWWDLTQVARLKDWIRRDHLRNNNNELEKTLSRIVESASEPDPTNLKDKLYYQERIGNLLHGALSGKLPWMQPGQPFLDEDLIDFITRIPKHYRDNKRIAHLLLSRYFKKLSDLSYAKTKSLPTGTLLAQKLSSDRILPEVFDSYLFSNPHPVLEDIFDLDRVKSVFFSLRNESALPPIRGSMFRRLPIISRFTSTPINRVHPATCILRLLALNLYLRNL